MEIESIAERMEKLEQLVLAWGEKLHKDFREIEIALKTNHRKLENIEERVARIESQTGRTFQTAVFGLLKQEAAEYGTEN